MCIVQSSIGFKIESDVGINECFATVAPFWLLETHYLILVAFSFSDGSQILWCCSCYVVASENFSRSNVSVEWFCLICCDTSTK
jgi:hypothetical protein